MIYSAEVIEVILKDNIPGYYTINFKFLNRPGNNDENFNTAIPLNMQFKSIPVPGEIVLIVIAASSFAGNYRLNEGTYYYLSIVNIQSNINYNGVPTSSNVPISNSTSFSDANLGISSAPKQSNQERKKKTFKLNSSRPLQLFEGDIVLEGRNGNSVRLSSTPLNSNEVSKQPTWTDGSAGDPILIISNTKNASTIQGFRVEDINKDDSSIYLTSTQRVSLNLIGPQTISTLKLGTASKNLSGKQIIMNSDRIVLNAKINEMFLSSNKGISVTSKGDIILESSKDITLNGATVNLTPTALYSAVNGEPLEAILNQILISLTAIVAVPINSGGVAGQVAAQTLIALGAHKSTKVKL